MRKVSTFQAVQKIQKNGPRCDLEPIRDQRVEPGWWISVANGNVPAPGLGKLCAFQS